MKLKDKIECTLERHVKLKENQSENIEKIVEEFAICFTNWCEENYYPSANTNLWFNSYDFETAKKFTTKELLEIYKKTLK